MRLLRWLGVALVAILVIAAVVVFGYVVPSIDGQRNPVGAHDPYPIDPVVQALHDDLFVGDLHADPLLWPRDLTKRYDRGQVDIPRLIEGNMALQVFTAVTKSPAGQNYEQNSAEAFDNITLVAMLSRWPLRTWNSLVERASHQLDKLKRFEANSDGTLTIIRTGADLDALLARRAAGEKVVGGLFGIEGGHALEGKIENLDRLYDEGLRLVGLHHFFDNELGGSLHGQSQGGLTEFGREVVREVAARGMILDVAHSSPRVVAEVLDMVDIPLIVSHTGVHSHTPVQRNIEDMLMARIAQGGGVIGIGFWSDVIGDNSPAGIAGTIQHAVTHFGIDHVALGSDFDGSVETQLDASELAAVTQALFDAGMPAADIRKVMGENMLRVFRARLH